GSRCSSSCASPSTFATVPTCTRWESTADAACVAPPCSTHPLVGARRRSRHSARRLDVALQPDIEDGQPSTLHLEKGPRVRYRLALRGRPAEGRDRPGTGGGGDARSTLDGARTAAPLPLRAQRAAKRGAKSEGVLIASPPSLCYPPRQFST